MTEESALKRVQEEPAFYAAYVKLGGQLAKEDYEKIAARFFLDTFDAYIGGEGCRTMAWSKFKAWLACQHPAEKVSRIFDSIDYVHPYT
jgi:hypothetical protein